MADTYNVGDPVNRFGSVNSWVDFTHIGHLTIEVVDAWMKSIDKKRPKLHGGYVIVSSSHTVLAIINEGKEMYGLVIKRIY